MRAYLDILLAWRQYYEAHPVRRGQALYNAIPETMCEKIVRTECDPYYDDNNIPACLGRLYELCVGS